MKTRISTKGQIILPSELREMDDIEPGQEFEIERIRPGDYRLRRTKRRNEGLVRILLACPARGWFKPAPRTESTDDIRVPKIG